MRVGLGRSRHIYRNDDRGTHNNWNRGLTLTLSLALNPTPNPTPKLTLNQTINTSVWGLKGLDNIRNNEYEAILVLAGIHTSHRFEKVNDTTLIYHYLFNKDYPEDEESIIMHKVK